MEGEDRTRRSAAIETPRIVPLERMLEGEGEGPLARKAGRLPSEQPKEGI